MLMMQKKCLPVEVLTWTSIILLAVEVGGSSTPPPGGSSTPPPPSTPQTPQQERPREPLNLNLEEADYIAIATFHKIAEQDLWTNLIEERIPQPLQGEDIENFKAKTGFSENELLNTLVPPVKMRTIRDEIKTGSRKMNAAVDLMAPASGQWQKKDVYALFSGSVFALHVVESLDFGVNGENNIPTDEIKTLINNRVSARGETDTTRPRPGSDEANSRRVRRRAGDARNPQHRASGSRNPQQ